MATIGPESQGVDSPVDAYRAILAAIGEDTKRDGLLATPARAAKAIQELTAGYAQDPATILKTTFAEPCDEMVVVANIAFYSLCEHHLLPFFGAATVAYVPDRSIVGLSKIPRLVRMFARRLQVQERMTKQIVQALMDHLKPKGAACVVTGHHLCMSMRGVESRATMTTSSLAGVFLEKDAARAEFLRLGVPPLPSFQ
jgi:GTP cyclohydrolase I